MPSRNTRGRTPQRDPSRTPPAPSTGGRSGDPDGGRRGPAPRNPRSEPSNPPRGGEPVDDPGRAGDPNGGQRPGAPPRNPRAPQPSPGRGVPEGPGNPNPPYVPPNPNRPDQPPLPSFGYNNYAGDPYNSSDPYVGLPYNTAPAAPAVPGYEGGGPPQYSPNVNESDPYEMFQQDRRSWYDRANRLDQDARDEQIHRFGLEGGYRGQADAAVNSLYGNPGYTPEESQNIIRQQGLEQYNLTPEQIEAFQFSPDQQAAIMGNPNSQRGWFNPAEGEGINNQMAGNIQGSMDDWRNGAYGTWGETAGATRGAIDHAALGPSDGYMGMQDSYLGGGAEGIRGAYQNPNLQMDAAFAGNQMSALSGGEGAVRGFTGDPNLHASDAYLRDHQFGPEAQREMELAAQTSIGNYGRSMRDRVERNAAQSGMNSPLALAAGLNNLQGQNAIDQEDAALNARVAARRLGLDTMQQTEDTRLGAEQYRGGLGANSELGLLRERVAANEGIEGMRLGAAARQAGLGIQGEGMLMNAGLGAAGEREGFRSTGERSRLQSRLQNEQYLGNTGIGIARDLGNAGIDNAINIGDRRTDTHRYNTNTGIGIERDIDQNQTARALGLAQNQQNVRIGGQAAMHGQNFATNNALSNRNTAVANQRVDDRNNAINYWTGQTNQQAQLGQGARGQRVSNFGTQAGAVNNATGNYGQYDAARRGQGFRSNFMSGLGRGMAGIVTGGSGGR